MVQITGDIKQMISAEDVIIVGTVDESGLCNVSPRSTFHVTDDEIYWMELFKHKTYDNFMKNPRVSVSVFDRNKLSGFQLKGKVSIANEKEFFFADIRIQDRITRLHKKNILKLMVQYSYNIVKFVPNVIYSLKPLGFSDVPGVIDTDIDQLGQLIGGVDMKSSFGLEKRDFED